MVRLPRNEKQTYRLNSRAQVRPSGVTLAMTLTLNFQGQNRICYISQPKMVRLPRNEKQTYRLLQASNVTNGFDLDHNLDLWILKVKRDLDLWPHTWSWPWIFMVKFWNSCISGWEDRLTLHKGGGSRSFMTMTIWWPRSGVWIYQIVTGVTSVVGVPSTHLVNYILIPSIGDSSGSPAIITMITSVRICSQENQAAHPTCQVIAPRSIRYIQLLRNYI